MIIGTQAWMCWIFALCLNENLPVQMHSLISNVTYCPNALPISKTCSVWSDNIHKLYEGSQDTIWLWRLFWISESFLTLNTCNAFSLFFLHKVLSPASLLILQYLQQQWRLEMMSFTFASFQFSFLFKDCMWRNLRAEIKNPGGANIQTKRSCEICQGLCNCEGRAMQNI